MKISNNNPGGIRPASPNDATAKAKPAGAEFSVSDKSSTSALNGISSRYKASDLQDAGKTDAAIRDSLRAILSEQPIASGMAPGHLEKLLDFMQSDPTIRAKITSYLQKTLS